MARYWAGTQPAAAVKSRRQLLRSAAMGAVGSAAAALLTACGAGGAASTAVTGTATTASATNRTATTATGQAAAVTQAATTSAPVATSSSTLAVTASSTTSSATPSTTAQAVVGKAPATIEVLMRGAEAQATDVKQAAAIFNKNFAGTYQATTAFEPGDYIKKLLTLMASDTMPDVFYINAEQASSLAVKGAFYNLNSIAAEDPVTQQYWPQLLDESKFQGKLFGLPKDFSPYVVWINLDRFKQAGVDVPKAGWTWNDYAQISQTLTQPASGGDNLPYYGSYVLSATWIPWVWQNGGTLFTSDYTKVTLDATPAVDAIQFLADLMNKSKIALRSDDLSHSKQTIYQWFGSGHIAMWPMGRWAVPPLRALKDVNWQAFPLPQGKTAANISLQSGPAVSATTKNAKASWEFLKVWTGPEGEQLNISSGDAVPPLNSPAIKAAFLAATPPSTESNQVFYDTIPIGRVLPSHGGMDWLAISQVTEPELGHVWLGQETAQEAVQKIVPQLQYLLGQQK
jgi:multiple sugar transport system substrate-binding protein